MKLSFSLPLLACSLLVATLPASAQEPQPLYTFGEGPPPNGMSQSVAFTRTARCWPPAAGTISSDCGMWATRHRRHPHGAHPGRDQRRLQPRRGASWRPAVRIKTVEAVESKAGRRANSKSISEPITSVAFSPDGELRLAAVGGGALALLWEVATGKQTAAFRLRVTQYVAFSPDGRGGAIRRRGPDRVCRVRGRDDGETHR